MQKWEYLEIGICDGEVTSINGKRPTEKPRWLDYLQQKGLEGWECYSNQHLHGLFYKAGLKRPLE